VVVDDVNGDGVDDMLLGTRHGGPGTPPAGEAYVLFGSPVLGGDIDLADSGPDIAIVGAQPGDGVGAAMAVGDVNGDGKAELIVMADRADAPRPDIGKVYVLPVPASP